MLPTGTYVTELIEYLPPNKLEHKYKHEIHCNEVAILPYYIANLNIEFTYQQKMEKYEEFGNICLVDTLDHCTFSDKQFDLFAMSVRNITRISEQNSRNISVVIGNPPYNANQFDENENNKNRSYPEVDKRVKDTYVKYSKAQKLKLSDPYVRFFKWATDRMSENGVLAFISNSSFLHKKSFDGLRKSLENEFSEIYIVDLGGDVRINTKLSGTTHNVFGIQLGVSISFLVKKEEEKKSKCKIFYARRPEFEEADEKLAFLGDASLKNLDFEHIVPDKKHNWFNLSENNFDDLLALLNKDIKFSKKDDSAIFKLYSLGNVTNRDDWLYDFSRKGLGEKISFFLQIYDSERARWMNSDKTQKINDFVNRTIKWTSELESHLVKNHEMSFSEAFIRRSLYRPFTKKEFYYARGIVHRPYQMPQVFPIQAAEKENVVIYCTDAGTQSPFMLIAADEVPDSHLVGTTAKCLPLYRYDENGTRIDNITDWGLTQFQTHYNDSTITKLHIFHYTYAVLHHPAYRTKYELNLKREFPRLPYYPKFHQWATWGKTLMELHLTYETAEPYGLAVTETNSDKGKRKKKADQTALFETEPAKPKKTPKAKLKADKEKGHIILDTDTTLTGVPAIAWDYKLGNRSALEWILDQYKEKKPRDPTIRELFNTYRFADYKEHVIGLLQRVCSVSVHTMEIIQQMPDTVEPKGG